MPPVTKEEPSKLKLIGAVMACSLSLHFNAVIGTFFSPFLYRLVRDYGQVADKSKAGYYAGYITGGYYLGRLTMSPMWGRLIDQYGRKICLIMSLLLTALFNVLFTWSPNFWLSVLAIFAVGLSNGLVTIGKTLSTEIVPKDLHNWSVAITSSFWLLGNSVGPFVGSYFLDIIPSQPFLLSGVAVSMIGVFALGLSILFVPETLKKKEAYNQFRNEDEEEEQTSTYPHEVTLEHSGSFQALPQDENHSERLFQYLKRKSVIPLIVINNINLFCTTTLGDTLPLWLTAHYDRGGLDLDPHAIGNIFAVLGPFQLLIQTVLYPLIAKHKGDLWLLKVSSTIILPLYLIIPAANPLFSPDQEFYAKIYVSGWLGLRYLCLFVIFSSMQKITNNSVKAEIRGRVNGIAQTTASLAQILGSYFGSVIIAWSMNNGLRFPFNHFFLFIILGAISAVSLIFYVYQLTLDPENEPILSNLELPKVLEEFESDRANEEKHKQKQKFGY